MENKAGSVGADEQQGAQDFKPRFGLPHVNEMMVLERMRGATASIWSVFFFVASRCNWSSGRGAHPGVDAISTATGVSRRDVQRSLIALQERGVLFLAKRGGGRKWASIFDVHPELMKPKKGGSGDTVSNIETAGGVTLFPSEKGDIEVGKGGKNGLKGVIPPAPSLPIVSSCTALPGGAPPSSPSIQDELVTLARSRGFNGMTSFGFDQLSGAIRDHGREAVQRYIETGRPCDLKDITKNMGLAFRPSPSMCANCGGSGAVVEKVVRDGKTGEMHRVFAPCLRCSRAAGVVS